MDRSEQLRALAEAAHDEGLAILECPLPRNLMGAYDLRSGVIYLRKGLTVSHHVAALAHELEHHYRGDDGHQDAVTEARINQAVARALISPTEYALAERITGGHTGAIALELDLPRWVVSAYRKQLWQGGHYGGESVTGGAFA